MFGIGPMLPVIPAAEDAKCSSTKVRKRKHKQDTGAGSHELGVIRRTSTIKTESTLIDTDDDYAVKEPERVVRHQRDLSLTVNWQQDDLNRMATELYDGIISDLELSLFAYWIKAKDENYIFAKELIRELALDQGYNLDRVSNARVRKLLQEVHDVRPRSVLKRNPLLKLATAKSSCHDRRKSLDRVLTKATTRTNVWLAAIDTILRKSSNGLNPRDPRNTPSWKIPCQNQTQLSYLRAIDNSRAVSAPLTARIDTLPLSLRLERERVVQEAARATMVSAETSDYPPNTPDRPAPLSVKSRGSRASNATPIPNTILRSVSTPIRSQSKGDLAPLSLARTSVMVGESETQPLVSPSINKDSVRSVGDIFGTVQGHENAHTNSFTDRLNSSEDRRHGTSEQYIYNSDDHNHRGHYQLDASDVASESSCGTFSSLIRKNNTRGSIGSAYNGDIIRENSFDALESYVGTEDEDQCSLLESVSTTSEHQTQTQYQFAVQPPAPQPVITGPAPTPLQRRATAEARRKSQAPDENSPAINFHRPLPLRSYESEATIFPIAGTQVYPSRTRARSVTSIAASSRHATETMSLPPLPCSSQIRSSPIGSCPSGFDRDNSHTKISERVDQYVGSISHRSSSASTLAAFPIPPMNNPVGELPMLVSRVASSTQALQTTSSQRPLSSVSLDDTYRAITKVNIIALLQRTRARGEGLQNIEWDKLSSFERAWREMNDILLVTVYGRKDVVLDETDVAYIDCIARELRSGSNEDISPNWIRRIFEDGV